MKTHLVNVVGVLVLFATASNPLRAEDGTEPPNVVGDWAYYNDMGWAAFSRGELDIAEFRFGKAIETIRPYAKAHPRLAARSYHDLSRVLCAQNRFAEARPLAKWVVEVRGLDPKTRDDAMFDSLYLLAVIERELHHDAEAAPLLVRAIAIEGKNVGLADPRLALTIKELADVEAKIGSYTEADANYRRAIRIHEYSETPTADLADALVGRAAVLDKLGREIEARAAEARAREVREQAAAAAKVRPAAR
ncbi:tetratricopeptide repeat protein [Planctomyces sp. SH-PL62]|uniref:tetratricopeptide repeat protein n=1 Tax=Planctomyces sp. SH-PL62 TaxID=1636152 RepID=UPI00078D6909|nr:tetratricopeptide repeat protein [Planctomyces sp. SH-PL62]AMV38883.1 Tetratricopeptide repeat protein [Planctomyces sp. SH-PL62]